MAKIYDFIVVGAGPAGCAIARRLADAAKAPEVLLIEAGSDNRVHQHYRHADVRFSLAFTEPSLNWGNKTTEQTELHGRRVDHARGKGLGGSTGINFSAWLVGASDDFDEWAKLTGDEAWSWPEVNRRLRKVENVHQDVAPESMKCLEPFTHSTTGNVDLTYAKIWDSNIEPLAFDAANKMGWRFNNDLNSGDPIGIGLTPSTFKDGARIGAAEAYLADVPTNLTILPDTAIAKLLMREKRAVGILTTMGKEFFVKHEVILSAGSINTPQILMLSGIGPSAELTKHNISVVHDLPGVGQHLIDHVFVPITHLLTQEAAANAIPPDTDPRYQVGSQIAIGFLRHDHLSSTPEFQSLPHPVQTHINQTRVPHWEISTLGVPLNTGPNYQPTQTDKFRSIVCFLMNLQSQGTVTLASADPADAPLIDSNYLAHPYDRRLAIDSLRAAAQFAAQSSFARTTEQVILQPASLSDDDLLEYWRNYLGSVWHMSGTVKLGKYNDDDDTKACLTPDFRVKGVQGLRVADMSVAPMLPCNHTQSTAYLVGETAAEKIIEEYRLN